MNEINMISEFGSQEIEEKPADVKNNITTSVKKEISVPEANQTDIMITAA